MFFFFVVVFKKSTKSCKVASKTAKLAPKPPKLAPRCSQVSLKTPNLASETAQDGPEILQLGLQGCFPRAADPSLWWPQKRGKTQGSEQKIAPLPRGMVVFEKRGL